MGEGYWCPVPASWSYKRGDRVLTLGSRRAPNPEYSLCQCGLVKKWMGKGNNVLYLLFLAFRGATGSRILGRGGRQPGWNKPADQNLCKVTVSWDHSSCKLFNFQTPPTNYKRWVYISPVSTHKFIYNEIVYKFCGETIQTMPAWSPSPSACEAVAIAMSFISSTFNWDTLGNFKVYLLLHTNKYTEH